MQLCSLPVPCPGGSSLPRIVFPSTVPWDPATQAPWLPELGDWGYTLSGGCKTLSLDVKFGIPDTYEPHSEICWHSIVQQRKNVNIVPAPPRSQKRLTIIL